jgi:hypothetical protein
MLRTCPLRVRFGAVDVLAFASVTASVVPGFRFVRFSGFPLRVELSVPLLCYLATVSGHLPVYVYIIVFAPCLIK